jgi:hypothetical protein
MEPDYSKGIFTIRNPELQAFVKWSSEEFVSQEEIEAEIPQESKFYVPVFDSIPKAHKYLQAFPALEGGRIFHIATEEQFDLFRKSNVETGINEMVLNRCLKDCTHECFLQIISFEKFDTLSKLEEVLPTLELPDNCDGGYQN